MNSHGQVDGRSRILAQAVAAKLEAGGMAAGLAHARAVNDRWRTQAPSRLHDEWAAVLQGDWPGIRARLLEDSERGARLRQNSPFCGILTPRERWAIYRKCRQNEP